MLLGGPVVLCHHGIGHAGQGEDPDRLVCAPEHLESHVRLLQRLGYTFMTAGALLGRTGAAKPRGRIAVLTFDDGWRDGLTTVAPLLERLGVPATFYVCPGWLGGQHPLVDGPCGALLDADDLRELHRRGMEVAAHTLTHPDLRGLGYAELKTELEDSRAMVEEIIGERSETFAYPFGLYDDRVERAAAAAGYRLAFAWEPRPWRALAAPRMPAPPRHGARRLAVKLCGLRIPDRVWAAVRQ
jgi:peptidoglycan/xylan/chitin deacetylase (PgdA/CDA1 family)